MSTGPLHIVHKLPGRIRLYCPQLRCNPGFGLQIEAFLQQQPGIKEYRANPKSGRILILYDRTRLSEQMVCLLLRQYDYAGTSPPKADLDKKNSEKSKPFELEDMAIPTQIGLVALGGVTLLYYVVKYFCRYSPISIGMERIASLITLITALPILRSGLESIILQRKLNNEILIGAATLLSLLLREGATGLVVVWLVNLSTLIETLTLDRSRRTIRTMLEGDQKSAWIVVNGQELSIPITQLQQADTVSVKLGSKIPVDGTVVEGAAVVNQAALTGEPIPVYKHPGDQVLAGSTIEQGTLYIRAERVGDQTSVARIIHLVEQATHSKAPIQRLADQYSARIIPASFLLAFIVFLLTRDIRRTMTILIVACPCAAGLATPTALSAAIGNAAGRGILVKGGRYLEEAGKVDFLLFDKTGTLTEGKPAVVEVIPVHQKYDTAAILTLAAAAEANANHPLANAIKEAAEKQGITLPVIPNSEMTVGGGVRAMINGKAIHVGNSRYLTEMGVKLSPRIPALIRDFAESSTLVYVGSGTQVVGVIVIQDAVRPNAVKAICDLRAEGIINIGIVSGDTEAVVQATANQLGVETVWSTMLPQDKFELVKSLKARGHVVGMVGDGINDSPSLALADVGVAMGVGGADAAIETAGIVLREDNPEKIVEVIRLGKQSLIVIRQNFLFAIGANILGLGLGSAKLISPFLAAILHNASTLAVVLNSTRLLSYAPAQLSKPRTLSPAACDQYTLAYDPELPEPD
ncbi:heavy metal translocating P-type ATPase [Sporomusa termitida]|uniref:Cd(2+)-exporting ATPase n=1 Tax=Sporomusa termitida TaxID=2377 RepID=A0A517DYR4_9FIRM|nr:cation-translocating P-type ATPase [Sporomusa termitida]QDR82376.1 putative manganese/zinc-exporting P-type ATPase [Sporomusa termitida]